ncbi:NADPH:quinone reductase-like Zn-dependent oxidoreductase [Amycolatopsis sulphurea]|uniref:NADPH:quinone reductase-like Zn-dependent oxidoreductase n=1 Tax=Amycolatopsis sulphurea TaxID=76022 RepID=A0A2A9FCR6_9PSEU|nr:zinc-binding dehydrogenase [Amycolatopsis sulphurea]PFG49154.1 NADPH:quinone reductase-like Zn-dependent oxidoreductase [Amycolatopsis sulphurea]
MAERFRAVRLGAPGGPLGVELVDRPAAEGVPVRMAFAGVNPVGGYVRDGTVGDPTCLPRTLGVEGVGEADGQWYTVYGGGLGVARDGTWAEWVLAPPEALVAVPDGLNPTTAARAGVVGSTAVRVVYDLGRIGPEDQVLVLGAAGGTGTAVTSVAAARGAAVWGQVGTPAKGDVVADAGAEPLVAATAEELRALVADLGITVAFDALGADYTGVLVDTLTPYGRLVSYGVAAGDRATLPMRALYRKNLTLAGYGGAAEPVDRVRAAVGQASWRTSPPGHARPRRPGVPAGRRGRRPRRVGEPPRARKGPARRALLMRRNITDRNPMSTVKSQPTDRLDAVARRARVIGKYLVGCAFFSVGAYLFIHSELGTDPLDTFALGVLRHLPLTVGVVQLVVAVVCVGIVAVWTRKRPLVAPLFTFFFCGSLIDLQLRVDWLRGSAVPPVVILAAGTVACSYGSALIIMSGFGIRSIDLLAITIVRNWRWPFWAGKGLIEFTLLSTGYLLGGPAGLGTVFFLVGVDLLIQPLVWVNDRLLGLINHGLPRVPELTPGASAA